MLKKLWCLPALPWQPCGNHWYPKRFGMQSLLWKRSQSGAGRWSKLTCHYTKWLALMVGRCLFQYSFFFSFTKTKGFLSTLNISASLFTTSHVGAIDSLLTNLPTFLIMNVTQSHVIPRYCIFNSFLTVMEVSARRPFSLLRSKHS